MRRPRWSLRPAILGTRPRTPMGGRASPAARGRGPDRRGADPRPTGGAGPGRRPRLRALVGGAAGPSRAAGTPDARGGAAAARRRSRGRSRRSARRCARRGVGGRTGDLGGSARGPRPAADGGGSSPDALRQHLRGRPLPEEPRARSALGTFLVRRGFDPETARDAIRSGRERALTRPGPHDDQRLRRRGLPDLAMRFALMSEPQQGLSYDEILAAARTAEDAGIEAYFRSRPLRQLSRHPTSRPRTPGQPSPAWRARRRRIGLGTLVSPVTFRHPGQLREGGRHRRRDERRPHRGWDGCRLERAGARVSWASPFPSLGERYDRLEESLAVDPRPVDRAGRLELPGRHWQVGDARFRPRPTRDGGGIRHLILGGSGGPRLIAPRGALRGRDQRRLRLAGAGARGLSPTARRVPQQRPRRRLAGHTLGDDGRARRRVRARLRDRSASCCGMPSPAPKTMPSPGSPSAADRWIMGTPDQAWERIARPGRCRRRSASCCRTSCRATSRWSASWGAHPRLSGVHLVRTCPG